MKVGYFLSSEEWSPKDLVELAVKAERADPTPPHFEQATELVTEEPDGFFDAYREHVLPRFQMATYGAR